MVISHCALAHHSQLSRPPTQDFCLSKKKSEFPFKLVPHVRICVCVCDSSPCLLHHVYPCLRREFTYPGGTAIFCLALKGNCNRSGQGYSQHERGQHCHHAVSLLMFGRNEIGLLLWHLMQRKGVGV